MIQFRNNRRKTIRRGFTLVEVIVMVTIVAILGAVVATTVLQQGAEGKRQAAKIGASRLRSAIVSYLQSKDLSRPGDLDLDLLLLRQEDGGGPNGPYLVNQDHLLDPWGRRYEIDTQPTYNLDWDIVSYGEDGQPGGTGPDEDIRR